MMIWAIPEQAVGCLRRINESNQSIGKLDEGGFSRIQGNPQKIIPFPESSPL
jgi:hypothetical protein